VQGKNPSNEDLQRAQIAKTLEELSAEVKALRQQIEARG
jgi:flagellin-like hook-associated protein FlgL